MKRSIKQLTTPIIMLTAGSVAGLLLLLMPGATLGAAIKIAGWALILDGAIKAIQMFLQGKRKLESNFSAAVQMIAGVAFMAVAHFLLKLIPIIVGFVLIALSGYKIKTALYLRGRHAASAKWIPILVLAAASVAIGIYVLFHPSGFTNTVIRILGAYLLVECAEDLYAYYVSR